MRKLFVLLIVIAVLFSGCGKSLPANGTQIVLSDKEITVDGEKISHSKNDSVYAANDIVYYMENQGFTYGEGTKEDEHTKSEADEHTVVHITKAGRYIISGKLTKGQIAVDLGDDAEDNLEAVAELVLNGTEITCTVAPAVIFYNVYECCDKEDAKMDVDTSGAGANVIVADGTENTINGSYVAKIYESYELNEDGTEIADSKKLHKYDGAFYSKMSMNINGEEKGDGVLNINAENEGIGSELHLTINGGIINITSGNDGINTNEDGVSVTTVNGGTVNVVCDGSTGEGDGIDSNGWLVINGGTVIAQACGESMDSGIDSDKGIYINGGKVVASGNMLDRIAGGNQTCAVFRLSGRQNGGNIYTLKNSEGEIVDEYKINNAFSCLAIAGDELKSGEYTLWQGEKQLSASKTGSMPNGAPPEFQGEKRPEKFRGERPPMPEGEFPRGESPDMAERKRKTRVDIFQ